MRIIVSPTKNELGELAAMLAEELINTAIAERGVANVILATGASQFEVLESLVTKDIDWSKVVMFHLDEYIGMPITHPASFRKYMKERFLDLVAPLKDVNLINGETEPERTVEQLSDKILQFPIDVALVGIGENGHLAFNDPPADFETEKPYLIVQLDEQCRKQQLGEGWFASLEEVPTQAISMSIRQIMKSEAIICSVPDRRKAQAIKDCLTGGVTNMHPSSILQQHKKCYVYLDPESANLLNFQTI